MATYCVVLSTSDSEAEAGRIAEALLNNELAACVNLIPAVTSIYRWQGKIERAAEVQLVIKTKSDLLEKAYQVVTQQHSYDTPEWLVLEVSDGSPDYLDWIKNNVQRSEQE